MNFENISVSVGVNYAKEKVIFSGILTWSRYKSVKNMFVTIIPLFCFFSFSLSFLTPLLVSFWEKSLTIYPRLEFPTWSSWLPLPVLGLQVLGTTSGWVTPHYHGFMCKREFLVFKVNVLTPLAKEGLLPACVPLQLSSSLGQVFLRLWHVS